VRTKKDRLPKALRPVKLRVLRCRGDDEANCRLQGSGTIFLAGSYARGGSRSFGLTGLGPAPEDSRGLPTEVGQVAETGSVYMLVAIIRKRLSLEVGSYQILKILSVTLFEKMPILQVLQPTDFQDNPNEPANQLSLFSL
jgi:hypothetical protein